MPPIEIKPNICWIGVNDRTTDLLENALWLFDCEIDAVFPHNLDHQRIDRLGGFQSGTFNI